MARSCSTSVSSASSSLTDALRDVLLDPSEALELEVHGRVDAGVLVPLYLRDDALHAVFTKRPEDMRRHAGEISFPGGRKEEQDGTLIDTALRETEEEIGLPVDHVEVLGALEPTPTVATNYSIYPYVGLIDPGFEWVVSPREVAAVLEFSLPDLRDGYGRQRLMRRGIPFRTDVYIVDDELIWGATARILGHLLARVKPLLDQ